MAKSWPGIGWISRGWRGTSVGRHGSMRNFSMFTPTVIGRVAPALDDPKVGGSSREEGWFIKHWSPTHASLALSCGNAEYVSIVRIVPEGMGRQCLARGLGWNVSAWGGTCRLCSTPARPQRMALRAGQALVGYAPLIVEACGCRRRSRAGAFVCYRFRAPQNADMMTSPRNIAEMEVPLGRVRAALLRMSEDIWAACATSAYAAPLPMKY